MRFITKADVSIKINNDYINTNLKQFSENLYRGVMAEFLGLITKDTCLYTGQSGEAIISLSSMNKSITETVKDHLIKWKTIDELRTELIKVSSIFLKDIKSSETKTRYESVFFDGKGVCCNYRENADGVPPYQVPFYNSVLEEGTSNEVNEKVIELLNDKFQFEFCIVSKGKRLEIKSFESNLNECFEKELNAYLSKVTEIYSGNVGLSISGGNRKYAYITMESRLRQGKELKELGVNFVDAMQSSFISELITKNVFYCIEKVE